jgi:hypothetical protein
MRQQHQLQACMPASNGLSELRPPPACSQQAASSCTPGISAAQQQSREKNYRFAQQLFKDFVAEYNGKGPVADFRREVENVIQALEAENIHLPPKSVAILVKSRLTQQLQQQLRQGNTAFSQPQSPRRFLELLQTLQPSNPSRLTSGLDDLRRSPKQSAVAHLEAVRALYTNNRITQPQGAEVLDLCRHFGPEMQAQLQFQLLTLSHQHNLTAAAYDMTLLQMACEEYDRQLKAQKKQHSQQKSQQQPSQQQQPRPRAAAAEGSVSDGDADQQQQYKRKGFKKKPYRGGGKRVQFERQQQGSTDDGEGDLGPQKPGSATAAAGQADGDTAPQVNAFRVIFSNSGVGSTLSSSAASPFVGSSSSSGSLHAAGLGRSNSSNSSQHAAGASRSSSSGSGSLRAAGLGRSSSDSSQYAAGTSRSSSSSSGSLRAAGTSRSSSNSSAHAAGASCGSSSSEDSQLITSPGPSSRLMPRVCSATVHATSNWSLDSDSDDEELQQQAAAAAAALQAGRASASSSRGSSSSSSLIAPAPDYSVNSAAACSSGGSSALSSEFNSLPEPLRVSILQALTGFADNFADAAALGVSMAHARARSSGKVPRHRPRLAEPVAASDEQQQQQQQQQQSLPSTDAQTMRRILTILSKMMVPITMGDWAAAQADKELSDVRDLLAVFYRALSRLRNAPSAVSAAAGYLGQAVLALDPDWEFQLPTAVETAVSAAAAATASTVPAAAGSSTAPAAAGAAADTTAATAGKPSAVPSVHSAAATAASAGPLGVGVASLGLACRVLPSVHASAAMADSSSSSSNSNSSSAAAGPWLEALSDDRVHKVMAGMATVPAAVEGVATAAHMDSGSNLSCASEEWSKTLLSRLRKPDCQAQLVKLAKPLVIGMFAGQETVVATHVLRNVAIDIKQGRYRYDLVIVPGANFNVVLGLDFMHDYAGRMWTRDFRDRQSGRYLILPLTAALCRPGEQPPQRPADAGPHWYPSQRIPLTYNVIMESWPVRPVSDL